MLGYIKYPEMVLQSSFSRSSDHLTDLYTGKSKINFVKNCPQWGLNLRPLDNHCNTLSTELSQYLVVCMDH